ncbi:tetratricopeptide repeat protein [Nocardia pseudovaccinii]|uniref:tetratricopeptide repeat protein n=1 Tax=Nocardia pseudovaccinii TaxID=189540 RepID=UPI003D93A065
MLDPDTAAELFITSAHRDPATIDRAVVAEIVGLCGYLPLAIVLLAGWLAHHPAWTITGLADQFAAAQDLAQLDAGPRAVRVAFTMSYQDLPPERQRLFQFLGLNPGLDIDIAAAAALANVSVTVARMDLEALHTDHLLEEAYPGRYRLHDLLREYARTQTDPPNATRQAVDRLLDYYQATAAADQKLARRPRSTSQPFTAVQGGVVPVFGDEAQALAWMRLERANLLACLDYTTAHAPRRVAQLTGTITGLLERDGPWPRAIDLHQRALTTARQHNDRPGEADALTNLGSARERTGDYAKATELHQQALALYRKIDNPLGEASTLTNLGNVRYLAGSYAAAADLYQQARLFYREIGNPLGEATTLGNLGIVHEKTGHYPEAVDLHEQALTLDREIGNRYGEASTLNNLGIVRYLTGDYAAAADLHQRALTLHREIGNRLGEAETLNETGKLLLDTGQPRNALEMFADALALARVIGSRLEQARALEGAVRCQNSLGDTDTAVITQLREAVALYQHIGAPAADAAAAWLATLEPKPPSH